jgi:hypothetical protein
VLFELFYDAVDEDLPDEAKHAEKEVIDQDCFVGCNEGYNLEEVAHEDGVGDC